MRPVRGLIALVLLLAILGASCQQDLRAIGGPGGPGWHSPPGADCDPPEGTTIDWRCVEPEEMVEGALWAPPGEHEPLSQNADPWGWVGGAFDRWGNYYSPDGIHCAQTAGPAHPCLNGYTSDFGD